MFFYPANWEILSFFSKKPLKYKQMHNYEIVAIIDPTTKTVEEVEKQLLAFLTDAKNLKINRWGLKKFAYPIKKHTSGHYLQINCQLQAEVAKLLPKKFNLFKPVLRHLIINLDHEKKFRYPDRPLPTSSNETPKQPEKISAEKRESAVSASDLNATKKQE